MAEARGDSVAPRAGAATASAGVSARRRWRRSGAGRQRPYPSAARPGHRLPRAHRGPRRGAGGDLADDISRLARQQQDRVVDLPAHRGAILDRHGRELAVGTPRQTVYAAPNLLDDPASAARRPVRRAADHDARRSGAPSRRLSRIARAGSPTSRARPIRSWSRRPLPSSCPGWAPTRRRSAATR